MTIETSFYNRYSWTAEPGTKRCFIGEEVLSVLFEQLTTPELKSYIREQDHNQEQAAIELCLRNDSGDLKAFFEVLKFQPKNINAFIVEARKRGVPVASVAAATGKSTRTIERLSPNRRQAGGQSDNWVNEAVKLAEKGDSFRKISEAVGVEESVVRRNMGVREAKAKADPTFDVAGESVKHYDRTIACDLPSAWDAIEEVDMLLDRIAKVYTLSKKDRTKLLKVLSAHLERINDQ